MIRTIQREGVIVGNGSDGEKYYEGRGGGGGGGGNLETSCGQEEVPPGRPPQLPGGPPYQRS